MNSNEYFQICRGRMTEIHFFSRKELLEGASTCISPTLNAFALSGNENS